MLRLCYQMQRIFKIYPKPSPQVQLASKPLFTLTTSSYPTFYCISHPYYFIDIYWLSTIGHNSLLEGDQMPYQLTFCE